MAKVFFDDADDENMSLKTKLQRLLLVTLALTSVAMAGNTTTSSTMRITVNVVPAAQLHLRTQPSGQPMEESLLISEKSAAQQPREFAASNGAAGSILIRQTYIAK
jgi:PhoPQ-activated pathogenicity-related protein